MKQTNEFATHYDAIVVGARCAGAATAMLMARQGARVLMVDWAQPGTDTMSTHALMRGAVMQLSRWGILDRIIAAGTPAIRSTTFQYGQSEIALPIKPSHGVDALYAPRRPLLDGALVDAARAAGVDVRFGVAFRDLVRDPQGRVVGAVLSAPKMGKKTVRAGLVIGADGRRSTVARRLNTPVLRQARHTISCAYAYYDGVADTGSHWLYAPEFGGGKIPTNNGQHCVFAAMPLERFQSDGRRLSADDPVKALIKGADETFGKTLDGATRASDVTMFAGQKGHMRKSWGPGWALVGDAGYFKDPLTAHGITDALRDAETLAMAALAGTDAALAGYQYDRDHMSAELFEITDKIAGFGWSLKELQGLHMQLNDVMKREQDWIESFAQPQDLAA